MEKISNIIFTEPQFNEQLSAWIEHIPFAFFLIEKLRPKTFVELGTQYGNSYFAFCQAISELKLPSKAYGVDIWMSYDEGFLNGRRIYEYANLINSKHFSHFSNLLLMTFDEALEYFNIGTIDLLHIDGMHDYFSVKHDFENWLPKMSDTGVIIFHDSNVRENGFGVWKLYEELKPLYPSFDFNFGYGLAVVCTGKNVPESFLQFVKYAGADPFIHHLFFALGSRWKLKNMLNTFDQQWQKQQRHFENTINKLESEGKNRDLEILHLQNELKNQTRAKLLASINLGTLKIKLIGKFKFYKHLKKIRNHPLFDNEYYLKSNPDVKASGIEPARHYLLYGGIEGRNPSEKFDAAFYLEQNPDVKASGMNPLLHYLLFGKKENRKTIYEQSKPDLTNDGRKSINNGKNQWKYQVNLMEGMASNSCPVRYFDQSIKSKYSYGNAIAHWEKDIRDFWNQYIDRYYEFFILSGKMKKGHILNVGAEFYNKYIKEVIAFGQEFTILDLKEKDHPDIEIIKDLDHYYKFDMTLDDYRNYPDLMGKFDTVLSFGVFSYYNITPEMCLKYLDNLGGFMKPEGLVIIKVDKTAILKHADFPSFERLHHLIKSRFLISEIDILTDENEEFVIYYCYQNKSE